MVALVSADSHVSEPVEIWAHLEKRFGSRLPRVSRGAGTSGLTGDFVVVDGVPPLASGMSNVGGYSKEDRVRRLANFDASRDIPAGAFDATARLAAMDADGLAAEVLYATYGLHLARARDVELQRACLAASNAWLAEMCRAAPRRLFGMANLCVADPAAAVDDLHDCLKRGLKGAAILAVPPPETPFSSSHYERFWAAAAEAGVPVALHALPPMHLASLVGRRGPSLVESRAMGVIEDYHLPNILYDHAIQCSLAQIVLSGVLERHPKLRLVAAEWGTAWIPNFVANVDGSYKSRQADLPLKMLPSEYIIRQVWWAFDRPLDLSAADVDRFSRRLVWGSDYPHVESSWPESRQAFDGYLTGAPADVRARLGASNCSELYGLEIA